MREHPKSQRTQAVATIAVNRSQKSANILRVNERCVVLDLGSDKRFPQIGGGIETAASRDHGISENSGSECSYPLGRLMIAKLLNFFNGDKKFDRLDFCHRSRPDVLFEQRIKPTQLDHSSFGHAILFTLHNEFVGDGFEGSRRHKGGSFDLTLLVSRRVCTLGEKRACLVTALPRHF